MAYKSKYYDPAKAHEYYMKHRKLKGRTKKASTSDLSDAGKLAAKEVKEQLQAELKAALKKVKRGNTAERQRLRELYNQKYLAELDEIRKDPSMLKGKKTSSKAEKSSKGKSTKSVNNNKSTKSVNSTNPVNTQKLTEPVKQKTEAERITDVVLNLKSKLNSMTDEQKAEAKELLTKLYERYKKLIGANNG